MTALKERKKEKAVKKSRSQEVKIHKKCRVEMPDTNRLSLGADRRGFSYDLPPDFAPHCSDWPAQLGRGPAELCFRSGLIVFLERCEINNKHVSVLFSNAASME